MKRTALILGASGGIGGETARALLKRGWEVRGLVRRVRAQLDPDVDWREGEAMDAQRVLDAAHGVRAIVHAANPPGYRDWDKLVIPMMDNAIAAARAENARQALPETIYNYDPATTPLAQPDSPQCPKTRKGLIRKTTEDRIAASGVRALIVRSGDFYGPGAGNNWLSEGMVKPGRPVPSRMLYPGLPGIGHSWAYLPDVGETFARLLEKDAELPTLARFHFEGFWDCDGAQFLSAIAEAAHRNVRARRLPWYLLPALAPFHETMREMIEMQVYWRHPVRLDNRNLEAFLGDEPRTPLVLSLRNTLRAQGSLFHIGAA